MFPRRPSVEESGVCAGSACLLRKQLLLRTGNARSCVCHFVSQLRSPRGGSEFLRALPPGLGAIFDDSFLGWNVNCAVLGMQHTGWELRSSNAQNSDLGWSPKEWAEGPLHRAEVFNSQGAGQ